MVHKNEPNSGNSQKPLPYSTEGKRARSANWARKRERRLNKRPERFKNTAMTGGGEWTGIVYMPYLKHGSAEADDTTDEDEGDVEEEEDDGDVEEDEGNEDEAGSKPRRQKIGPLTWIYTGLAFEWLQELEEEDIVDEAAVRDGAAGLGVDLVAGANIELSFEPHRALKPSKDIRLLQFKGPIHPDNPPDTNKITVDRWSESRSPYYGLDDMGNPQKVVPDLVRDTPKQFIGRPMVGKGEIKDSQQAKNPPAAYMIDMPREPCRVGRGEEKNAFFMTYAYDVENERWLGGVSWGYTVSVGEDGIPKMELRRLSVRSKTGLQQAEMHARTVWNSNLDRGSHEHRRQPVPKTDNAVQLQFKEQDRLIMGTDG